MDLIRLEQRFGVEEMERIYFHAALFDLNKLVSLRPDMIDVGAYERFVTPRLAELWQNVTHNIFGQWRYENSLPEFRPPPLTVHSARAQRPPISTPLERPEVLASCGGGKDSLVSMKLLERGEIPYSTFAYSHSVYGSAKTQHALIDGLLDHCRPQARHRMWIFGDFLNSPVLELHPELGSQTIIAGETPSALFASLPVMLEHGYSALALGHEASANRGNLVWDETGEDINHQWGKSLEAENLLNRYIQETVVDQIRYFGILQPIHDVVIFNLLNQDLDIVPVIHSCNIKKPWCKLSLIHI